MTLTDDALVRSLTEHVDRTLPPMSLDPATVAAGGRRYRRRRTGTRIAGGLGTGLALVAVAVAQGLPADRGAPSAPEPVVVRGLTFVAAVQGVETETDEGVLYDLGLPYDVTRPDGERVAVDVEPGEFAIRPFDPATGAAGEIGVSMRTATQPFPGLAWTRTTDATVLGIAPPGTSPEILVAGVPVGTLPTFEVPGVAGDVFFLSVSGEKAVATWPVVVVRYGVDADGNPLEVSLEQGPAPSASAPVELAPGVLAVAEPTPVTLDDGTWVVDLGIEVSTAPEAVGLALVPLTDDELAQINTSGRPGRPADGGVQIIAVGASGRETVAAWPWSSADSPTDADIRWDTVLRNGSDETGVFIGVVPPWVPQPRVVVLYSAAGFTLADGSRVQTLEAPVYPAPTNDGRFLYTVQIPAGGDGAEGFVTDVDATFAIGSDGTVVPGQRCAGQSLDECAAVLGPDVYEAVRAD